MQEQTDNPVEGGGESAPKNDSSLDLKSVEELMNRVVHSALTRYHEKNKARFDALETQFKPKEQGQKDSQEPSDVSVLREEIKKLRAEREADAKAMASKEINSHVLGLLSRHNVQMTDIAAKVLSDKFSYENGTVVAKDELGVEIKSEDLIKSFLDQNPGFKPPRNVSGTSSRGGGGASPAITQTGQPTRDDPNNWSYDRLVEVMGEDKAKKFKGLI